MKQKSNNPWKTIKRNIIYKNKYGFTLRDDVVINPSGVKDKYMVLENSGYVGIVALTQERQLILVEQWRYPIEQETTEIIAGYIESNELLNPIKAAKRELKEEIGGTSKNWHFLGTLQEGTSYQNKQGKLFLAENVRLMGDQHLDDTEKIKMKMIPFPKAVEMVIKNKIKDDKTITGILMTKLFLESHRKNH